MENMKNKTEITTKHPIQPLATDHNHTLRFKKNAIVDYLLDFGQAHNCGLNELSCMNFPKEDWIQFAQLIGYSLSGFSELSYVDNDSYKAAEAMSKGMDEKDARIQELEATLKAIREGLREPIAELYGKHPDDLMEKD